MATAVARSAPSPGMRLARRHAWAIAVWALLFLLLLVARGKRDSYGAFDLQSLALYVLPLALAAAAQAVIVISGGIDLSIGALMAVFNVLAARYMVDQEFGGALLIAAGILVAGVFAGALNGFLITITRVPDIIVTLAMAFVWGGVALLILGSPGGGAPQEFMDLAGSTFRSEWISNAYLFLLVCLLVIWLPIMRSRIGLAIYAIGSDSVAAFRSGVDVGRSKIAAYAVGGLFSACGGLALTAGTGLGDPLAGSFYTLAGVSAIVLGGVSLVGGRGGILGPIGAAFVLGMQPQLLLIFGVDPNYSQVIQGVLLVAVVMVGGLAELRRSRT